MKYKDLELAIYILQGEIACNSGIIYYYEEIIDDDEMSTAQREAARLIIDGLYAQSRELMIAIEALKIASK